MSYFAMLVEPVTAKGKPGSQFQEIPQDIQ